MGEEFKKGYIEACVNLNTEINDMISKMHNVFCNSNDRFEMHKLSVQIEILWEFKKKIENAVAKAEGAEL